MLFDENNTFAEIAFGQWNYEFLFLYALIFLPFIVVVCNPHNSTIRLCWLLFSVVILVIACLEIPDAVQGRWGNSTKQNFGLFYQFIVPIPSIIFIAIGLRSMIVNKRMQSDHQKAAPFDGG